MRAALLLFGLCTGCVGASAEPVGQQQQATVYGADDRRESYEVTRPELKALATNSVVALMPRSMLEITRDEVSLKCDPLATAKNLCQGEAFGDQPSCAFCSGVLVDWETVLTAFHCAHAIPLTDVVAVFGYEYTAPDELGRIFAEDVFDIAGIRAQNSGDAATSERVDYAFLELSRAVTSPRRPAAVYAKPPPIQLNQPLTSAGFGMGVPVKFDLGGSVRDLRANTLDYFVADTDTFAGSSGAGVFDAELGLVGVLARGGPDYAMSDAGCFTQVKLADGAAPEEQYTYAHRTVEGLCQADGTQSSLCRPDCSDPCQALDAKPPALAAGGDCAVTGGSAPGDDTAVLAALALLLGLCGRRQRATGTVPE